MRYDAVVIGAGHNGLTSAAYLARAGRSVLVLERAEVIGGAARSARVFPAYDARLSAYSYLLSLLPEQIVDELGLCLKLHRRRISSYTPTDNGGILIDHGDPARTAHDLGPDAQAWEDFAGLTGEVAHRLFPTMTEPLRSAKDVRSLVGEQAWTDLFARPIGETLQHRFTGDAVRGIALTDGLIGTFARAGDADLLANRCLLYHVIGRGTGDWDVPVGGIGRVTDALADAALAAGAQIRLDTEVVALETDGELARVRAADGSVVESDAVFAGVAPVVLDRLRGRSPAGAAPEGAQLKVNMLLSRLPALKDPSVTPEQAFSGTLHINEGYAALDAAYLQAARGQVPTVPPCEVYCHSLSDPSILGEELVAAGAHTLTLFGLHMPTRLFSDDPAGARQRALELTLASVDSVLAEPIEDCLLDASTLEVRSPLDVEASVGMPGGHIFHGDLQWPFAESSSDVGTWGVETADPNVYLCGAGARRGGGVSGIPGRNAVAAHLGEDAMSGG
ncbi:MAG: phytoene desaturase family protein [Ornithinimicrobium sp.]|jgi:phytoene dehydrogenase-like protein|uniref:phytoene desaturase family protein n=1 Tax=Ornithinimicrobium sp. TaxID=1977084 RepID=UPI003D9BBE72